MYPRTVQTGCLFSFSALDEARACRGLNATLVQLIRGQQLPLTVTLSLGLLPSHIPGAGK